MEIQKIVRKHQSKMMLMIIGLMFFTSACVFLIPLIFGIERDSFAIRLIPMFFMLIVPVIFVIGHFFEKTVTEIILTKNKD